MAMKIKVVEVVAELAVVAMIVVAVWGRERGSELVWILRRSGSGSGDGSGCGRSRGWRREGEGKG